MDLAFESVGTNGKFQKILTVIVLIVASAALITGVGFPFLTKKPELLCREKGNELFSYHVCHEEEICDEFRYEYIKLPENNIHNVAYEFDMYCEKAYFSGVIGTSFFLGGMVGSLILSPIPDKYGRKSIYQILLFFVFLSHISFFLANSLVMITITNFIAGFCAYSYSMSTLIITEYLDRRYSGIIMSINNAVFPLTGIILAFFFMYVNNWRILFLISSIVNFVSAGLAYKYFLESPRWLNSKNKMNECFEILKEIAKLNGREENYRMFLEGNSDLVKNSSDVKEVKTGYNILEISRLKSQRNKFFLLIYIWFASGFCFYGLILNIEHLGGDIFVDSMVTFIGEIISELASGFLADEFGRVIILKSSGILGGVGFILYDITNEPAWLKSVFVFMTSFGFSATFNLIYVYSPECFPTTIRSTVIGFLYLVSRFGALLVPSVSSIVPRNPILFGILSLLSAYCSSMLPETLGVDIPDDVPESKRQYSFLSTSNKSNRQVSRKETALSDIYFKIENKT